MQLIFVCWFCIMQLYWICLLILTVFLFSLVESYWFLCIRLYHLQIETILLHLFQLGCLLFLFLAKLTRLGHPVLCLIGVVRLGVMSCSWSERKTFNLSPLSMLAVGFYYVEACFFHMQLTEVFLIMKGCCILSNPSSISIERVVRCFTFICSINIMYHTYWFLYVEPFLHPRDEFHLLMVRSELQQMRICWCWIWFAGILLAVYHGYWPIVIVVAFLVLSFAGFISS